MRSTRVRLTGDDTRAAPLRAATSAPSSTRAPASRAPWTACRSTLPPTRPWASSANRAAASRSRRSRSSGSSSARDASSRERNRVRGDAICLSLDERRCAQIRGNRISMIFQEPMTALNPVFTVGDQIAEVRARARTRISRREAWDRAVEMLGTVGIPAPAERAREYPHQLSGGMRQRVMIAMALMMHPALAHRRRADHRARRHDPGADPRAARRAAGAARRCRSC